MVQTKANNENAEAQEVLSVDGMAAYLGISQRAARSLLYRGEIPFARVGSKLIRIRRADLERYLEEQMVTNQ